MKLDVARLCLDCEEVHEHQVCPHCGSEAFAFLTRWVQPTSDVRLKTRVTAGETTTGQPRPPDQVEALRQLIEGKPPARRSALVLKGLLGVAAFGLAGWAWRSTYRPGFSDAPPAPAPPRARGEDDSDRIASS
jgi:hypothetical protein